MHSSFFAEQLIQRKINWSYRERREGQRPATPISREYSRYFLVFVVFQEKTPHNTPQHARVAAPTFQPDVPTLSPQHQQQQQQ
jgi:hypothetical protein